MVDEATDAEKKAEEEKKKKESELEKTTEKEHEKLPEEQKKKAAEKQKEEPKKPTLLDKVFDFGYHAAMAVGATALGLATAGTAAPIVAGAFAGGGLIGSFFSKKEKPSLYERVLSSLRVYSVVNSILHPMVLLGNATYPLINNATLLGKAARALYGVTLYNMTFLTSFKAGDHLIKNKFDFKGIGKSIKDNWVPMYKRFALGFSPAYVLTANGIASIAGYPTFAVNALPLGMYNGINPPGPKKKAQAQPTYTKPDYKPSPA